MKQSQKTDILQWLGTIFTIAGATASSFNFYPQNVILFNIGSVFWVFAAIELRNVQILVVNIGLLLIYAIGFLKILLSSAD